MFLEICLKLQYFIYKPQKSTNVTILITLKYDCTTMEELFEFFFLIILINYLKQKESIDKEYRTTFFLLLTLIIHASESDRIFCLYHVNSSPTPFQTEFQGIVKHFKELRVHSCFSNSLRKVVFFFFSNL